MGTTPLQLRQKARDYPNNMTYAKVRLTPLNLSKVMVGLGGGVFMGHPCIILKGHSVCLQNSELDVLSTHLGYLLVLV